jgi:D-glycero-D-manno-heptose 1,7-bisphosphate phosphatase
MTGRALFLDRDGTLIEHVPYLADPKKVNLLPGVRAALIHALDAGFALYLHTNQSGVARGYFTLQDAEACNRRMFELLDLPVAFTDIKIACEGPADTNGYRKPSPRFLNECIARDRLQADACFMIGDNETDIECGRNAGIEALALLFGAGSAESPDWPGFLARHHVPAFTSFPEAVAYALKRVGS